MSIIDDYTYRPNDFEQVLMKENAEYSNISIDSAYISGAVMTLLFFHPIQQHNNGDAFRHCFWSAMVTQKTNPEWAKKWTDAHEAVHSPNNIYRKMDEYNNSIGISILENNRDISVATLIQRCLEEISNGNLRTVDGERKNLIPSNINGFNVPSVFRVITHRSPETLEYLVRFYSEICKEKDGDQRNALHRCIIDDYEEGFKILSDVIDPNSVGLDGETPLIICSRLKHGYKYAPALLDKGAEPNFQEETYGETALMTAAVYDNEKMVDILLAVSDKKIKSKKGLTAYDMAISEDNSSIAKKLL